MTMPDPLLADNARIAVGGVIKKIKGVCPLNNNDSETEGF